jgi:ribonucleoside-triphosphate reductase
MIETSTKILSDITVFGKYAKYLPDKERRESWEEIVNRYLGMMIAKYPVLADEIVYKSSYIFDKKILPSMRALQFAGAPIDRNPSRVYNCAYLPVDDYRSFSEAMFLLLGGTGVGYSVQFAHIDKLPEITKPTKSKRFLIGDSIEGWADAVKALMKSYFGKTSAKPEFDFRDIRPKGARLITAGGKAPGPEPLKVCLFHIQTILDRKSNGEKLTDIECHDIMCHIANAVLAGGIRRAAMICLFSFDSEAMLNCKTGNWWELNEQRGRANNSAVIDRNRIQKDEWNVLWNKIEASGSGEPGVYFTNNPNWGTNPCCEIALRPYQFCNLSEVNVSDVENQEDLNARVEAAAFFGTLQAGFTDFHYLRDIWKKTTEKDALIGVGMTGIGSGVVLKYNLEEAANVAKLSNEETAKIIGINAAARVTTVKPSGTSSCVLGTSSGIHAWHNTYYLRSIRLGKNEALYTYLAINAPELLEDDFFRPETQAVVRIPQKAPEGAILRTESALDLLERTKKFNLEWVRMGHRSGANTNNVSATISIDKSRDYNNYSDEKKLNILYKHYNKTPGSFHSVPWQASQSSEVLVFEWNKIKHLYIKDEWEVVGDWMWNNRDTFNGLSVLPYDNGTYVQAPFEDISVEEFERRMEVLKDIDLTKVIEIEDITNHNQEAACAGGRCEV